MASNFYNNTIKMGMQLNDIKKKYNPIDLRWCNNTLSFYLEVKPTLISKKYIVYFEYKYKHRPRVRVSKSQLQIQEGIPHIYSKESNGNSISLCLYYPKNNEFNSKMRISEKIIPWAIEWLYFYEIWIITGKWLGGGHGHENEADEKIYSNNI